MIMEKSAIDKIIQSHFWNQFDLQLKVMEITFANNDFDLCSSHHN